MRPAQAGITTGILRAMVPRRGVGHRPDGTPASLPPGMAWAPLLVSDAAKYARGPGWVHLCVGSKQQVSKNFTTE